MDGQASQPVTQNFSKVALAAGTTTTLSTTGTTVYSIRSRTYSKTAITNGATPTTDIATGKAFIPVLPGFGCQFLVGLDKSGVIQAIQGEPVALNSANAFVYSPQIGGPVPETMCIIGQLIVLAGTTASAAGWIFGTSNMSSVTGITYNFDDLSGVPDRPQAT